MRPLPTVQSVMSMLLNFLRLVNFNFSETFSWQHHRLYLSECCWTLITAKRSLIAMSPHVNSHRSRRLRLTSTLRTSLQRQVFGPYVSKFFSFTCLDPNPVQRTEVLHEISPPPPIHCIKKTDKMSPERSVRICNCYQVFLGLANLVDAPNIRLCW